MENQLRIHSNLTIEDMMYNHNIDKKKHATQYNSKDITLKVTNPPPTSLIFFETVKFLYAQIRLLF